MVQGVNPEGQRLVLLFDSSTSMRQNDPSKVAYLGGELVMGLVGSDDNVGVITYSDSADVVLPMRPAGNARARSRLRASLAEVERNGITDFGQALERARQMLEAANAPRGSSVILLTDGIPYRGRRREVGVVSLGDVVAALKEKGWRIFAIALGPDAQTPFLSLLVAKTGGAVFPVEGPDTLLETFEDVSAEALGYLRAEREAPDVQVVPHTNRVAFLGRWKESTGELSAVTRDGEDVGAERVIKTPQGAASYAVALIEKPETGRWKADMPDADERVTFVEPRFALEFVDGQPPETVEGRSQVELAVRVVGGADALEQIRSRLSVRARLALEDRPYGRRIKLKPMPGNDMLFRGTFRAPPVDEETSLRVIVEAVLVETTRPFVLRRSRALTVKPGAPGPGDLILEVSPDEVNLARWAGRPYPNVSFTVTGDPERATLVTCGPERLRLAAGASGTLTPKLRRGLRFLARSEDGSRWSQTVQVKVKSYQLRGESAKGVEFAATPAGLPTEPVALDLACAPRRELVFERGTLIGPGGRRVPVQIDGASLRVQVPSEALPGEYVGDLKVRAKGVDLEAFPLPLKLRVLAPWKPPASIALEGSWGWTSRPVEIAWPSRQAVPVTIRATSLVGEGQAQGSTIRPTLDIRVVPLDGWGGDRLSATPRRFALEVFVSSDLPAGDYVGVLDVTPRAGAGQQLKIPIRLGVKR